MKIRDVANGEVITEQGLYRMSMSWYHAQCCDGPSVSSTGIRVAQRSPFAFWQTSSLNPDATPEGPLSDALILGRATHTLILGDEVFDDHFAYVPASAPPRPTKTQVQAFERDGEWSESAAPRAAFWEGFDAKAEGKLLIKEEQVERILKMGASIKTDPTAMQMLTSDMTEISMIWQDEQTGLWIKSRPDCIPNQGCDFGDLKTFSPKNPSDLVRSAFNAITDRSYQMQMALAVEGAQNVMGQIATSCGLVFVQTTAPFECIPIQIDEEAIYWARVLNRQGINRIAEGLETGIWPSSAMIAADNRSTTVLKYAYPPSMVEMFAEMQMEGLLPSTGGMS